MCLLLLRGYQEQKGHHSVGTGDLRGTQLGKHLCKALRSWEGQAEGTEVRVDLCDGETKGQGRQTQPTPRLLPLSSMLGAPKPATQPLQVWTPHAAHTTCTPTIAWPSLGSQPLQVYTPHIAHTACTPTAAWPGTGVQPLQV